MKKATNTHIKEKKTNRNIEPELYMKVSQVIQEKGRKGIKRPPVCPGSVRDTECQIQVGDPCPYDRGQNAKNRFMRNNAYGGC
jgi:hypothetical protein